MQRLGRNYWKVWCASGFSNLGDAAFRVAILVAGASITQSPAAVAGIAFMSGLPWLVFALHAGAISDRVDRRRMLVAVDFVRAGLIGTLVLASWLGMLSIPVLYVVVFLLGTAEALFDTAAAALVPRLVHPDHLPRANARLYAVELASNNFLGKPIGGLLAGIAVVAAFSLTAALYLVAAFTLITLTGKFRADTARRGSRLTTDILLGVRLLWGDQRLRYLALMVGVLNIGVYAAWSILILFSTQLLGLSEVGFGVLLTVGGVGSLAGSWLAERLGRARSTPAILRLCIGAISASLALRGFIRNPILFGVFMAIASAGIAVWTITTVSWRQRIVPDEYMGRMVAGHRLFAWGSLPIGAAVGGLVGQYYSLPLVFIVGSVLVASLFLVPLNFGEQPLSGFDTFTQQEGNHGGIR